MINTFDPNNFDPAVWFHDPKRPEFCFNRELHQYFLNKQRILGFSEIKEICGIGANIKKFYTPESAWRGTRVHEACAALIQGVLNWDEFEKLYGANGEYSQTYGVLTGYVRSYEKGIQKIGFSPKIIEIPNYHPILLYGVTPDQVGEIKGSPGIAIGENKTGKMLWWTKIQTAFQAMAQEPKDFLKVLRFGMELRKDGEVPKIEYFKDPEDFSSVMAWHRTAHEKVKYGEYKIKEAA